MTRWFPWRRSHAQDLVPEASAATEPAPIAPVGDAAVPSPAEAEMSDEDVAYWAELQTAEEDPDGTLEVIVISRPGAHPRGRRV